MNCNLINKPTHTMLENTQAKSKTTSATYIQPLWRSAHAYIKRPRGRDMPAIPVSPVVGSLNIFDVIHFIVGDHNGFGELVLVGGGSVTGEAVAVFKRRNE